MFKKIFSLDDSKLNILLLIIGWLLLIVIINPAGEFPFGDDFAYAKPVKHLLETGQVRITDWSSMTLVAQLYIGALFAKIFGFSFTALRFVGLIAGICGVLGIYRLTLIISRNKRLAMLAAFVMAFHPYYYLLSYSFTTDVPFFAFIIWSIYYYTRTIQENKTKFLVSALALNIIALLIRDLGILIPAAFAVAYAIKYRISFRTLAKTILPLIIILITFALWRYWMVNYHGITKSIDFSRNKMLNVWSGGIIYLAIIYIKNILYAIIYTGVYAAPFGILLAADNFRQIDRKFRLAIYATLCVVLPVFVVLMLVWKKIAVDVGDFLTTHLVGHNFFWKDIHNPSHANSFFFPEWLLLIISAIGLAMGILLVYLLIFKIISYYKSHKFKVIGTNNGVVEFLALIVIIYLGIIFSQIMVNRYLILPLALIIVLSTYKLQLQKLTGRVTQILIAICLLYYFYNSVSASHDMMTFNRTRWEALSYLNNEMKIAPDRIDGGFEYNAWHFYRYDFPQDSTKNWWFVKNDDFVVSWGRIDKYRVIREYNYTRWYPPCFRGSIFILEKK